MRQALTSLLCLGISSLAFAIDAVPPAAIAEVEERFVQAYPDDYVDLWQLYEDAIAADPRIRSAQGRVISGEGRKDEARGQLLPQLTASASYNRADRREGSRRNLYNGERYALSLTQVLFDTSAWRSYKRFSSLAEQRMAEYENVKDEAIVDLVQRYFTALAMEDELALVKAERRATQRNLDRVNSLYERQMATVTDKLQISARVDALVAAEVEAANEVAVSREALSELVGYPVVRPLKRIGADADFLLPGHGEAYWVSAALESNPALAARQDAIAAAEAAVGEAKGGHLPTVSLFASAQQSELGYDNTLVPETDTFVVGVGLQIPLFSGGSTSARVRSIYGELIVAQQAHEELRRQVIRETRTAFLNARASVSKITATRQALISAERAREASEKSFAYGVGNAVDVLDAVEQEYRARRDYLQSQYGFVIGLLVLNRWAGSLEAEHIRRANDWLVADAGRL